MKLNEIKSQDQNGLKTFRKSRRLLEYQRYEEIPLKNGYVVY